MRQPRDSFGRAFKDVGGDEWSIDAGWPVITPDGTFVPPSGGGEVRYGVPGGIAPSFPFATSFGSAANALSVLSRGSRFAPPRSFTCQSIGMVRTAGDQAGNVCLGIYDSSGNLLYKKQKNNLWTGWGGSNQAIALTIDPFDFDASEEYVIAARSTVNLAALCITSVTDFRLYQMFQDTLPPNANAERFYVPGRSESIQSTFNTGVAAPDLDPTIAAWAGGIQFVQVVGTALLFFLREEPGNIT